MKLLIRATLRNIFVNSRKIFILALNLFVLTYVIFFVIYYKIYVELYLQQYFSHIDSTLNTFIVKFERTLSLMFFIVLLLSIIMIVLCARIYREADVKTTAIYYSLGVTKKQILIIFLLETGIRYAFPIFTSSILGLLSAKCFVQWFYVMLFDAYIVFDVLSFPIIWLITGVTIFFVYIGVCFNRLFQGLRKKTSILYKIKQIDSKIVKKKHNFYHSNSFKTISPLQQIAIKNIDFYQYFYQKLSISLTCSLMYLIVGIFCFFYVADEKVILDNNPYDTIDTTSKVLGVIDKIIWFWIICLLMLFVFGILQTIRIIHVNILTRKKTYYTYNSVGMTKSEYKTVLCYEYWIVLLQSFLWTGIFSIIINLIFKIIK